MNFSLSIDRRHALRLLLYLAAVTAFYVVFAAVGSVWGGAAGAINILPFLTAAIAFYDGPYTGGAFGFYGGMLMSLASTTVDGADALILGLFGIVCGSLGVVFMRRILPSVIYCGTVLLALRGVISATYYRLFYAIPFTRVLLSYVVIILVSLAPGAAGYFVIRAIHGRFSGEEDIL